MNFQDLHELLRLELIRRIDRGTLTRSRLASQAGFRQAHVSNFLNRKRSLSLEGLDRMLTSQNLTVEQILPLELKGAAAATPSNDPIETVPVVPESAVLEDARISAQSVIEAIHISASRLYEQRSRPAANRAHWQRFVAVRVDAQQGVAMEPLLTAGAIVVIDRHYNSLARYRAQQPTLYAARSGGSLLLRYIDLAERQLMLRPISLACPVQVIALGPQETAADHIVGRVCLVYAEM